MKLTPSLWTSALALSHLATTGRPPEETVTVTFTRTRTICLCDHSDSSTTTGQDQLPWLAWNSVPLTSSSIRKTVSDTTTAYSTRPFTASQSTESTIPSTTPSTTISTTISTTTRTPACPTTEAGIECGPPNGLKYGYNCGAKVISGSELTRLGVGDFHECLQKCAAYPLLEDNGTYYIQCAYFSFTEDEDSTYGLCTLFQKDDSITPEYGYDKYSTRGYWLCQGSNGEYATCDANCPGQEYRKRWERSIHANVTLATKGQFAQLV